MVYFRLLVFYVSIQNLNSIIPNLNERYENTSVQKYLFIDRSNCKSLKNFTENVLL